MDIKVGTKVRSIAGRDMGKDFIVVGIDGGYVMLADGDLRKVDSPKKKKLKHIQASNSMSVFINEKMSLMGKVTNAEVRKALVELNE